MFKIETIKISDDTAKLYKAHSEYGSMSVSSAAALHLLDSMGTRYWVGSGAYCAVHGVRGCDHVYKIGSLRGNEGYHAFVTELSKMTTHNPLFPEIYGARIYKYGNDSVLVVAMERLEAGRGRLFSEALDVLSGIIRGNTAEFDALNMAGAQVRLTPALTEALCVLYAAKNRAGDMCRKKRRSNTADWDLHSGNFMIRGANQLVVTDPLA